MIPGEGEKPGRPSLALPGAVTSSSSPGAKKSVRPPRKLLRWAWICRWFARECGGLSLAGQVVCSERFQCQVEVTGGQGQFQGVIPGTFLCISTGSGRH